jgi:hypothetical protein
VRCLAVLDLGGTQRSEHLHPSFVSPADRLDTLLRDEDRIARATRQAASSSATSGAAAGIRRNASAAVEAADAREEAHRRARDAGFQKLRAGLHLSHLNVSLAHSLLGVEGAAATCHAPHRLDVAHSQGSM